VETPSEICSVFFVATRENKSLQGPSGRSHSLILTATTCYCSNKKDTFGHKVPKELYTD